MCSCTGALKVCTMYTSCSRTLSPSCTSRLSFE
jgi:hypothetical protein